MKPDDEGRTLKSSLARLIMPRSVYEQTTRVIMVNRSATEAPWCCAYVIFENFSTVNEGEDMIGGKQHLKFGLGDGVPTSEIVVLTPTSGSFLLLQFFFHYKKKFALVSTSMV